MAEFLIGTSGYDYPEWKGVFYPQDLKRTEFLSYYASVFNALELNFSFYGMPTPERLFSFYERTEGKLNFSVKANQTLTHQIDFNWKENALAFMDAVKPLQEKDVLSAVLFQFPESFHYTNENRIYLAKMIQAFEGFPCVIEFRHKEWVRESVFDGIEKLKASICFCDMPQLKNLPDMNVQNLAENLEECSCPFIGQNAYIRLHGRNENAWYTSSTENNGSARYTYDYSNDELVQFVPVINNAMNSGKKVHVFFNNHPNGNGAKNGKRLKEMVQLSNLKIF